MRQQIWEFILYYFYSALFIIIIPAHIFQIFLFEIVLEKLTFLFQEMELAIWVQILNGAVCISITG